MMRKLLIAIVGWFALAGGAHATLVQHWKLDDNAASTTVVATVGSNASLLGGDNTSAKATTGPGGTITAGFDLNGSDDSINATISSVGPSAAFSVSAWAKFDSASAGPITGTISDANSRIEKTSDTNIQYQNNSGLTLNFTVPSLGTTNWHHILFTRTSGNSCKLYVDGTQSSSGAQTLANGYGPSRIGRGGTSNFFDGKLAQVKIFNSDESANVASLYAEGSGGGGGSTVPRQAIVVGSLSRPYQPTDIDWRCSPFAAFFGALAP